MPIDPKEALEYLGINPEEVESLDAYKETFSKTYIKKEAAHLDDEVTGKIFGRVNGSLRSTLKTTGKELGIEAEWDKIDPKEGIQILAQNAAQIRAELAEAKKGKASSKEVEELSTRYAEAKKLQDELKEQLTTWESKYTNLEQSVKQREVQAKVEAQWDRAFDGVKWNEGVNKYAQEGFKAAVKGRYTIEFDEDGQPYAADAQSKKRIPNPNKAHDFLGLDDLVKQFAEQEKLTGGNPQGGTAIKKTFTTLGGATQQQPQTETKPVRRVMPAAR
jgi:hypothetical protein